MTSHHLLASLRILAIEVTFVILICGLTSCWWRDLFFSFCAFIWRLRALAMYDARGSEVFWAAVFIRSGIVPLGFWLMFIDDVTADICRRLSWKAPVVEYNGFDGWFEATLNAAVRGWDSANRGFMVAAMRFGTAALGITGNILFIVFGGRNRLIRDGRLVDWRICWRYFSALFSVKCSGILIHHSSQLRLVNNRNDMNNTIRYDMIPTDTHNYPEIWTNYIFTRLKIRFFIDQF